MGKDRKTLVAEVHWFYWRWCLIIKLFSQILRLALNQNITLTIDILALYRSKLISSSEDRRSAAISEPLIYTIGDTGMTLSTLTWIPMS